MRTATDRYLHHVTITTGHVRRSPRSEVSDAALATCREMIRRSLAGGQVTLPEPFQAYRLSVTKQGRCLVATVYAIDGHVPLVTFGVAGHSRCGARLWASLHQGRDVPPCPPEPWCAVRIEPSSLLDPEAMHWLGDLERCVAWAWLESQ